MKPKNPALNAQILDEASEWFVDFRVGDVDAHARERFDEWLRRSPEHIRAYIDIARTYVELPPPNPKGEIDVQALIAYANSHGSNVVPLSSSIVSCLSSFTPAHVTCPPTYSDASSLSSFSSFKPASVTWVSQRDSVVSCLSSFNSVTLASVTELR